MVYHGEVPRHIKKMVYIFPHSEKLPNWLTIRNLKMNIYLIGSFRHEKNKNWFKKILLNFWHRQSNWGKDSGGDGMSKVQFSVPPNCDLNWTIRKMASEQF